MVNVLGVANVNAVSGAAAFAALIRQAPPGTHRWAPMNAAMSARRYHTERPILM
jgi:hypothetical protein